ncbi:hypothetical protein Zmor_019368 [Zophobas morio]|uniref:Ionotropic receptor n=1 Tax=Zophobas morio TaxID=2755281 RepID=A0AA38I1I9_9CUCU|nr:hypothetical protein Zmor_019368 [Zophobas morio]
MSIFSLVTFSLLVSRTTTIFVENIDKTSDCLLRNQNFWSVYQAHFCIIEYLTIHVLESSKQKYEVNEFVESVLQILSTYNYFITIKVRRSALVEQNPTPRQPLDDVTFVSFDDEVLNPVPFDEFAKIKVQTTDSAEGHLLVAWDADLVSDFLNYNHMNIIPESRATYAILVLNPNDTQVKIHHVLQQFWTDYNVANVIAQKCSCRESHIYKYRPFVKIDNSWGSTTRYSLDDVATNLALIINPLLNFNQFPLNISIFPRTPTAVVQLPKFLENNPIYQNLTWSRGFAGMDGLILGTLAEYFNFDVTIVSKLVEDDYGKVLPNGTIIGSLGDIAERRAAFNANGRLLAYFLLDEIEFTRPYTSDEICVVVPKAAKVPRWKFLYRCLDHETWMCMLLTIVAALVFWYNVGPTTEFPEVFYYVYSYMFGIPIKTVTRRLHRVVFLVPCMTFGIVISGIIQGSFFKNLTTVSYNDDITTLEEVADSGMSIGANVWHLVKDNSDLIRRLKANSFPASDDVYDSIAYQRDVAAVDTRDRLELLIRSKYMDEDGSPLLHIVNECITIFLTANIVPKNSPFLTSFNGVISKLFEGGLTSKWYDDIVDSMITEKIIQVSRKKQMVNALSLFDTQGAFYFMIVGCGCSIVVFLCEVLSKRRK